MLRKKHVRHSGNQLGIVGSDSLEEQNLHHQGSAGFTVLSAEVLPHGTRERSSSSVCSARNDGLSDDVCSYLRSAENSMRTIWISAAARCLSRRGTLCSPQGLQPSTAGSPRWPALHQLQGAAQKCSPSGLAADTSCGERMSAAETMHALFPFSLLVDTS